MIITVKDVIEYLSTCHPDDLVILASDGEGNSFAPLASVSLDMYHDREITLREVTPEQFKQEEYSLEDIGTPEAGYIPCVTFWP